MFHVKQREKGRKKSVMIAVNDTGVNKAYTQMGTDAIRPHVDIGATCQFVLPV